MKKLLNKIRRKQPQQEASRITAETLAEHRERVLAGGRRFKYPLQTARHRLVIIAIIIGTVTLAVAGVLGYWQLYVAQNTSDFMYRVTRIVPLPVAVVDGQQVRYSDYLMKYRGNIHFLEKKELVSLNSEDGMRQSEYHKQQAMQDAIADAYAAKIAKERDITVTAAELEAVLKQQRDSTDGALSEASYETVILDNFGWSPEEYRHVIRTKLLRQKVAFAVDTAAEKASNDIATAVASGTTDLKAIAESINATGAVVAEYGATGWIPRDNQDGGLSSAAAALSKGSISSAIKSTSGDGYYFVKLIDSSDTQVNYEFVHIPLTVFEANLADILDSDKVKELIDVPDVAAEQ